MPSEETKRPSLESDSPWHAGEVALQRRLGVEARLARFGRRAILEEMPEQHRLFYNRLPMMLLGGVDATGAAWATSLVGDPGFVEARDGRTLLVRARPPAADPAAGTLAPGASVGLLGLEPHSRRRNRVNGQVTAVTAEGFELSVQESFGNCPQYIQARAWSLRSRPAQAAEEAARSDRLDDPAHALIAAADTFFVASYVDDGPRGRAVDLSHRGGPPGFVRITADGDLLVPDYAGNRFFNTLGNILINPRIGLLFIDFASGDLLQISGDADILFDVAPAEAAAGIERLWHVRPRTVVRRPQALGMHWGPASPAPEVIAMARAQEAARQPPAGR